VLQLTQGAFRDLIRIDPNAAESDDVMSARESFFDSFANALDLKKASSGLKSDAAETGTSDTTEAESAAADFDGRVTVEDMQLPTETAETTMSTDDEAVNVARRGDEYLMERKFELALKEYNTALAITTTPPPVRARILLHRASAHILLDSWKEAEADYRAVLDIAEAGIKAGQCAATRAADEAHNGLIEVFCANHRYEDAVDQLKQIDGQQQRAEGFSHLDELSLSLKNKGGESYKAKDWMGAVTMYSYALRLAPLLREFAASEGS